MALTESVDEIVENSNNPLLGKHESWERVRLGEIADIQNGFAFKSAKFSKQDGVPLIRIRDVVKVDTETFYTGEFEPEYMVQPGDLLVGMDGDFNCARWRGSPGLLNQRVCRITLNSDVLHPKLLDYALPGYLKAINEKTSSVTVKHLSSKTISEIPLPVPPPEQQEKMVAEIEKQFSRLDEAVAGLKRVKANLKRYKAAVLKAAIEGKLTEEWRKQNPDVEPASKLLERILAERRTKWEEAELAKMKAKGKEPKNDKWKEKYKEPAAEKAAPLSEIPESWILVRLDEVCEIKGGITKDSKRKASSFDTLPYLRVANVQRGWIDINEMKEIDVPTEKIDDLLLESGDVLFNEGGDRDKLGRGWVWEGQIDRCVYQNHVFRARPILQRAIEPMFISWYGNGFGQKFFMARGKQTTNLASINKTMLSSLPVPLPPTKEQIEIRSQVEVEMARIDSLESYVEKGIIRATRLRQSVLADSFTGDVAASRG